MTIKGHPSITRETGSGKIGVPPTLLGARLRELRFERGLTQSELGPLVGTEGSRISDWELGISQPTLTVLQRFAAAFNITVSQLLDGVM